jgi:tRNA splicing ligase
LRKSETSINSGSRKGTLKTKNIMKLADQLEILKITQDVGDVEKFKEQYKYLKENFTSESEIKQIDDFVEGMVKEFTEKNEQDMEEIRLRCHLILNKEIIPVSYIAKNYFKKSKDWLYQRINGNIVNGKPATFSKSEVQTFSFALQDIGKKLGSIV